MPPYDAEPGTFFGPASPKYARSEALGARITEYSAWLNAGEYRLLEMIHEFDREELWHLDGIRSCAHWLSWKCGVGRNAAREKVRVANALAELPQVSETYRRGEISYSKVRAITRVATPENEEYLLMIARYGTAAHVEGLVSKYRRCKRLQDRNNALRQHTLRELACFYDDDGSCVIRGRFPAEVGALIQKALQLAMDQLEREAREERRAQRETWGDKGTWTMPQMPPKPGEEGDLQYGIDPTEETQPFESFDARRADALVAVAENYLAAAPKSASGADRYQVVVHVSAETLKSETTGACVSAETPASGTPADHVPAETSKSEPSGKDVSAETSHPFRTDLCYLEDGPHVSAETARRLGCDASKIEVTVDKAGEPLNIGRKSRIIPPAMRRALRIRDDGCRFPGCTHKYFIDGHHMVHWADGGETSMENVVQLCRYHHRLVHEHGFGCERTESGEIRFTNALGNELGRTGALPPVAEDAEPREWLEDNLGDLGIDSETCVTQWRGERIDWALAVGHLFD
jgi:hypothetical protein